MAVDYKIDPEAWRATNDTVKAANQEMAIASEDLRNIIKNTLRGAGMEGEVADTLADAYDREVLSEARKFGESVEQQVSINSENLERYNAMQEASAAIADR